VSDQLRDRDTERIRVRRGLCRWFRTPPRPHGDVEYSREVSFLELFYDLVHVVVIGQAARTTLTGAAIAIHHHLRSDLARMVQRHVLA